MRIRLIIQRFLVLSLALATVAPLASAETLFMRNGGRLTGNVVRQTRTSVYIRTRGRVRVIPKSRIRRIVYGGRNSAAVKKEQERKAAEAKRRAAARRRAAAVRRERERKAAEAKKAEEERKAAEAKKAETERKAAEAKKAEEERKAAEAKKAETERKAAEAKKAEDERKAAEAKKAEGERKAAEAKRADEERKAAEAKQAEDERKAAEAKKAKEERKAAEVKKAEDQRSADAKREDERRRELDRKREDERKAAFLRKEESRRSTEPKTEPTPDSPGVSPLGALLWSAAAPGLGQWRSGRRSMGGTYGGLAAAAAFGMYTQNRIYRNAVRDYESLNDPFAPSALLAASVGVSVVPSPTQLADPFTAAVYSSGFDEQRAAVDRHYRNVQKAGLFFGSVYALSLADAYFFHPAKFGQGPVATTPLSALAWSAAYPGLGQWRSGRRGAAALHGLLFTAALAGAYDANRNYRNSKRTYEQLNNPYNEGNLLLALGGQSVVPSPLDLQEPGAAVAYDQSFKAARADVDRKYAGFRTALYAAGAVYVWSLADAFLFHPGRSSAASPSSPSGEVHYAGARFIVLPAAETRGGGRIRPHGQVAAQFEF